MSQPTYKQLLNIAQTYINGNMQTLKPRDNDGLDFYEVSVWNLEAALTAAWTLGFQDGSGQEHNDD